MLLGALAAALPIFGFGQNKVQYDRFLWRYLDTPHFNLYYHEDQGGLPSSSARWVEKDFQELRSLFGFKPREKFPLIIFGSPSRFQETNIVFDILPEEVGGFTEMFKSRIVVPFDGSYRDYRHVLRHELAHAFQYAAMNDVPGSALFRSTSMQMPLWFAEGMAEYLSSSWNTEADMFLMDRTINGAIPPPGPELDGYMAYKGGQSFFYFLASSNGPGAFGRLLRKFRELKSVDGAFKDVYGKTPSELGEVWVRQLRRLYWPEIGRRDDPERIAKQLTFHEKSRSYFNLKPRISPDGEKTAYFSDDRDYAQIVIIGKKGAVIRRIGQYGYGGYFESFHPFRSGVCWSPASDRIAFVTKFNGADEIRIVNVSSGRLERTVRPKGLAGVSSPDWSADGRSIVFCGLNKERSDLYLYLLESGAQKRLTDDDRYESNPRFSPDGKTILFTGQDPPTVPFNRMRDPGNSSSDLYLLDAATGSVQPIRITPDNEKQAAFSGDGKRIVFVSDRNGIDNLYVAPLSAPDSAQPTTDIIGGCSDPDWSRDGKRITFCLFQKQGWDIWSMEDPDSHKKSGNLAPTRWAQWLADSTAPFFLPAPGDSAQRSGKAKTATVNAAKGSSVRDSSAAADSTAEHIKRMLDSPPGSVAAAKGSDSASEIIGESGTAYLSDTAAYRAPDTSSDTLKSEPASFPYGLKLSPDLITVGFGINSLYGYAAGQAMVVLSDLFGDHQFMIAGDLQGRIDQLAHLYFSYLCLKYRIDFGTALFYTRDYPYQNAFDPNLLFQDTRIGGEVSASYPFSLYTRLDLTMYGSTIERVPVNGSLDRDTSRRVTNSIILLPSLSGSFDNILWGLTGPINGVRAQAGIMISPPLGGIDAAFASGDIDVRAYWHIMNRFVWANRVTMGGALAFNDELPARRYFLGGTENWLNFRINGRNYEHAFDYASYSDFIEPFRGWDYFSFTGSRYAVFNSEFRFPFIKDISIVWPLPATVRYINGAIFADVGNAWDPKDEYKNIPLPQTIYGGIGYGLRVNLGIFVVLFDRGWKTDWRSVGRPTTYFSLGAEF